MSTPYFRLPCRSCGETGGVMLSLEDLDEMYCTECEETFTASEMKDFIAEWDRFFTWLDAAKKGVKHS